MIRQFPKSEEAVPGEQVLHRIAALTLAFGFASAAIALVIHRPDWAKGLAGGAVLGWLNFRWLSRGIRAILLSAAAQAPVHTQVQESDSKEVQSETGAPSRAGKSGTSQPLTFLALIFRYALVGLGVYVIFSYLHVPLISIGLGLCAFVAAILAASVWEIVRPGQ
jgi:hypothetical protein